VHIVPTGPVDAPGELAVVTETNDGRVGLFALPISGSASEPDGTFVTSETFSDNYFGSSAANAGDVNGDGLLDLAIGDPEDDEGGENAGAVYILFGE
jgi:hypothetical protein